MESELRNFPTPNGIPVFQFVKRSLIFFQFIELEGAPVIINKAEIIRNFGSVEFFS